MQDQQSDGEPTSNRHVAKRLAKLFRQTNPFTRTQDRRRGHAEGHMLKLRPRVVSEVRGYPKELGDFGVLLASLDELDLCDL